jgi:cyclopropane-fatty-acyl-phospholipid synthase
VVREPLTVARAFVRGEYCPSGDLIAAVREQLSRARPGTWTKLLGLYARLGPGRWLSQTGSPRADAAKLRFHYDRSNEFYRQFLDAGLVYSCAYFESPGATLEEAQRAKLDLICRKLELQEGERLLDIGCGWGALLIHASRRYGVRATGCTVSQPQAAEAFRRAAGAGLHDNVQVLEADYRSVRGRFEKIASVGMFEHVGPRGLRAYFGTVRGLLSSEGLFLNQGIVRPQPERDSAETLFLRKAVFPLGSLSHLSEVVGEAENAGFEVLDVENLRPHYARTCREWVQRLERRRNECLRVTDAETYRTWQLYLAASAYFFDVGRLEVHQVLMAPRGRQTQRWTRDAIYRS